MHDRDAEAFGGLDRRQRRHPEVRVDDVRALVQPLLAQVGRERGHVLQQLVLRDLLGRAGVDVVDLDAAGELDPAREPWVVAPRVHDDAVAELGQRARERGHVDVLPTGVDSAEHSQRTGVFGNHCDSHGATSAGTSNSSQSDKKRSRP